jgi:hypothetical protein
MAGGEGEEGSDHYKRSHNSSQVMFVYVRVALSLIKLKIYPHSNAKHMNKNKWDMMRGAY